MGLITALTAVGVAVSAAGTIGGIVSGQQQAKAQKQAQIAQFQQEEIRKRAMDLDATRKRREVYREAQKARAAALSTSTAQGSSSSSVLGGAYGGISGQEGANLVSINQSQELGQQMFDSNAQEAAANMKATAAGSAANTWAGIGTLGGSVTKNAGTIGKIGGWT